MRRPTPRRTALRATHPAPRAACSPARRRSRSRILIPARTPAPVTVAGETSFASISPGGTFACGIGGDGILYCWGSNRFGALGIGGEGLAPVQCGADYTCAHAPTEVHGQPES